MPSSIKIGEKVLNIYSKNLFYIKFNTMSTSKTKELRTNVYINSLSYIKPRTNTFNLDMTFSNTLYNDKEQ